MLQAIYYLSHNKKKKIHATGSDCQYPLQTHKGHTGRRAPRTSRGRGHASTLISIILSFTFEASKFQSLTTVLHPKTHREIKSTLFFQSPFMLGGQ